ncbi:NAD(P)H-hydrate dehydratase [Candidatus Woesearchaeota archaeon]|nr:NAD(P)H-hydrate dehydratase [Candidatus Woesearchaeota archaeon]
MRLRKRDSNSRKGDNGRVLVIGGSIDYVGAAYLAGMAAFRSGADLVHVAAPEKAAWALNCLSADLITKKFRGNFFTTAAINELVSMSKKFDVTVIGNGIGKGVKTLNFAAAACRKITRPKVIDADAISAIKLQDVQNSVITPHAGEYLVLMRNSNCDGNFGQLQKIIGSNVVVLKGHVDKKLGRVNVIISKDDVAYSKGGNPGMTVGGTGDVLAGLIAGLMAQHNDPLTSAKAALYANGKAADKLLAKYGYGFTASDLLEEAPQALKKIL